MSRVSSAGLLYLYLSGYEEDGKIYLQQVDSYRDIEEGLYSKIMAEASAADADDEFIHIFAVVGSKEKADVVYSIVETGIMSNFQKIISSKRIETTTKELDRIGNIFFSCVQEFFCEQLNHFPKRIYRDYEDIVFCGICCSHFSDEKRGDSVASELVDLWLERESPMLCGRQLMTKSFFMYDFVNRKIIAALPDAKTGSWRLVFEGGHQMYLNGDAPYIKETILPDDVGTFTMSNIQSILMNPIYAFGKWFQPNDICEEWHKVFLYLCAVSDVKWDQHEICKIYEKFLRFLEDNICVVEFASAVISKEQFCNALIAHINSFRGFLKGEDEPVISKDLHQTLNSRYVYLPHLWQLINPTVSQCSFSSIKLRDLTINALEEKDVYKKGVLWEDVAAYVLSNVKGWKITGHRIKAGAQEIDLSLANVSLDNELWKLGAYILVECKNWKTPVDIHQIRNIAHISSMKGNKTAILFATNDITADAQDEIYRLSANNINIICITAEDLLQLYSAEECKRLIINKWKKLRNNEEALSNMII